MEGQETRKNEKSLSVPGAILIAGIIIAGAIVYTQGTKLPAGNAPQDQQAALGSLKFRPVSESDHIRGNPQADITIIEYSDTECPFCKRFHETMKRVVEEYGKDGRVAWIYRHFPLDALHSKARKEAAAVECAGKIGGAAKFWDYLDQIFAITPSNDGLDTSELPKIAKQIGLDTAAFNSCLESGETNDRVNQDYEDGIAVGIQGTPYALIVETKTGKVLDAVPGAYPYEQLKSLYLDPILKRTK